MSFGSHLLSYVSLSLNNFSFIHVPFLEFVISPMYYYNSALHEWIPVVFKYPKFSEDSLYFRIHETLCGFDSKNYASYVDSLSSKCLIFSSRARNLEAPLLGFMTWRASPRWSLEAPLTPCFQLRAKRKLSDQTIFTKVLPDTRRIRINNPLISPLQPLSNRNTQGETECEYYIEQWRNHNEEMFRLEMWRDVLDCRNEDTFDILDCRSNTSMVIVWDRMWAVC